MAQALHTGGKRDADNAGLSPTHLPPASAAKATMGGGKCESKEVPPPSSLINLSPLPESPPAFPSEVGTDDDDLVITADGRLASCVVFFIFRVPGFVGPPT